MTYELTLQMDDKCQLREMKDFVSKIEFETGLICEYDGQVEYDFDGEIHIYEAEEEQVKSLLMLLQNQKYRDVKLTWICRGYSDDKEPAEWYSNKGRFSERYILFGTNHFIVDKKNMTKEKVWKRFNKALKNASGAVE